MFHRVEIHIIHTPPQISIIAYRMFIKAPLPNPFFPPPLLTCRNIFKRFECIGKFRFQQTPAQRIIIIAIRQSPNRMNMIRQHTNRHRFKSITLLHKSISFTQQINLLDQQAGFLICQFYRKEKRAARKIIPTIMRHLFPLLLFVRFNHSKALRKEKAV